MFLVQVVKLLSSFGSSMGLYLGVSVLSLFEYVELLVDLTAVLVCRVFFRAKGEQDEAEESSSDEQALSEPARNPPPDRPSYYRPPLRRRKTQTGPQGRAARGERGARGDRGATRGDWGAARGDRSTSEQRKGPETQEEAGRPARPVYVNKRAEEVPKEFRLRRIPKLRKNRVSSTTSSGEDSGAVSPNTRNPFRRVESCNSLEMDKFRRPSTSSAWE